jgi:hypothetical protein
MRRIPCKSITITIAFVTLVIPDKRPPVGDENCVRHYRIHEFIFTRALLDPDIDESAIVLVMNTIVSSGYQGRLAAKSPVKIS